MKQYQRLKIVQVIQIKNPGYVIKPKLSRRPTKTGQSKIFNISGKAKYQIKPIISAKSSNSGKQGDNQVRNLHNYKNGIEWL